MVANGDIPLLCFFDDLRDNTGRPITVGQMQAVDGQRRVFQCLQRRLSAIECQALAGMPWCIGLFRHVHPNGEIFMLLLAFKLACPEAVFMNRGNHEQRDLNERPFAQGGGFAWECRAKYPHDENLIELFQRYAAQLWRNSFAIPSQFGAIL